MSTNQTHTTDRQIFVYGLFDPITDELRYIGKTVNGMQRVKEHSYPSRLKNPSTHKKKWIAKHVAAGRKPHHAILAYCTDEESANSKEVELIAYYLNQGFSLTNATDGGEGAAGYVKSAETRKKISDAYKNMSPEAKASRSAKLSAANTGNTHTDEAKAKIGAASVGNQYAKGNTLSDETRAKMSASAKGRKHSEQAKANMSKSAKKRWAK